MRVLITESNERNLKMLWATSETAQPLVALVNELLGEAVKARSAKKRKPDPVPARHS